MSISLPSSQPFLFRFPESKVVDLELYKQITDRLPKIKKQNIKLTIGEIKLSTLNGFDKKIALASVKDKLLNKTLTFIGVLLTFRDSEIFLAPFDDDDHDNTYKGKSYNLGESSRFKVKILFLI